MPHSLEGVGDDGSEFIICFDNGKASEFNTLLVTDRFAHTRPEDLALNFGVPAETFSRIPPHHLYIFHGQVPGPLGADLEQSQGDAGPMPFPSTFQLIEVDPTGRTKGGFNHRMDWSSVRCAAPKHHARASSSSFLT